MARQKGRSRGLAAIFGERSPEALIVGCRLAVALIAYFAVWPAPSATGVEAATIDFILGAILVYAVTIGVFLRFVVPDFGMQLTIHLLDVAMLAALMHFVDGGGGGQFFLFALAALFATLRWSWMGVGLTCLALLALYLASAWLAGGGDVGMRDVASRGGYLAAAAVILTYLAALRQASLRRLARLTTDWPVDAVRAAELPSLEQTLAHALSVTGARSAAALWQERGQPTASFVCLEGGRLRTAQRSQPPDRTVDLDLLHEPFLLLDDRKRVVQTAAGRHTRNTPPIDPDLMSELSIRTAAVAPVAAPHANGHLLLIDVNCSAEDMLLLAEAVASRVANQVEHHILDRRLAAEAAAKERAQIGRDLHDGTLQAMTAISLHLQAMLPKAPKTFKHRITELRELVTEQQRALREYLTIPRQRLPWEFMLEPQLAYALREAAELWGCAGFFEVAPRDAKVSLEMGDHVNFLIKEVAANAVRHGGANRIDVRATVAHNALTLVLRDNGRGIKLGNGANNGGAPDEQGGPRSLASRVRDLGGSIVSAGTAEGVEVTIELPLQRRGAGPGADQRISASGRAD